jgi:hypothetical protein
MRDARTRSGPVLWFTPGGYVQVCGCVSGWRARPSAERAGRGRPRPLVRAVCGAWCCRVVMIAGGRGPGGASCLRAGGGRWGDRGWIHVWPGVAGCVLVLVRVRGA